MFTIYDEKILMEKAGEARHFSPSQPCILIAKSGKIVLQINNTQTEINAGDMMIISPMKIYQIVSVSANIQAYFILYDRAQIKDKINVNLNKIALIQSISTQEHNKYSLDRLDFQRLWVITQNLFHYTSHPEDSAFSSEIIIHSFTLFIYFFADNISKNSSIKLQANNRKEDITVEFISLLSQHIKKERQLRFYAEQLFVSIKYMSICVKEITRKSPQELIALMLLDEAKNLLVNTKEPIASIADKLNFSDQYAFGKFFKKHQGLSPKFFRKSMVDVHAI